MADEPRDIPKIIRKIDNFRWDSAPDMDYKPTGDHFSGVRRVNLAGMRGEQTKFHVR